MSTLSRQLVTRSQNAIVEMWPPNTTEIACDPQRDARAVTAEVLRILALAAPFPTKWSASDLKALADEVDEYQPDTDLI